MYLFFLSITPNLKCWAEAGNKSPCLSAVFKDHVDAASLILRLVYDFIITFHERKVTTFLLLLDQARIKQHFWIISYWGFFNVVIYPVRNLLRSFVFTFINKMCFLLCFQTLVRFRNQNHIYVIKSIWLHAIFSSVIWNYVRLLS